MKLNTNEYLIVDDFLPRHEFEQVQTLLFSNMFPYFYNPSVSYANDDHFVFYHIILDDDVGINSPWFDAFNNIFFNKIDATSVQRCRINNYPRNCSNHKHEFHVDKEYEHNVALWYCNTCNGPTVLKILGEEIVIEAKENRMVFFHGGIEHTPISQTDSKLRINVNINYTK